MRELSLLKTVLGLGLVFTAMSCNNGGGGSALTTTSPQVLEQNARFTETITSVGVVTSQSKTATTAAGAPDASPSPSPTPTASPAAAAATPTATPTAAPTPVAASLLQSFADANTIDVKDLGSRAAVLRQKLSDSKCQVTSDAPTTPSAVAPSTPQTLSLHVKYAGTSCPITLETTYDTAKTQAGHLPELNGSFKYKVVDPALNALNDVTEISLDAKTTSTVSGTSSNYSLVETGFATSQKYGKINVRRSLMIVTNAQQYNANFHIVFAYTDTVVDLSMTEVKTQSGVLTTVYFLNSQALTKDQFVQYLTSFNAY